MQLDDFPSASARETVAYCWEQVGRPEARAHRLLGGDQPRGDHRPTWSRRSSSQPSSAGWPPCPPVPSTHEWHTFGPPARRLRGHRAVRGGALADRRLAPVGRVAARLRPGDHRRLPAPAHPRVPLAHGPPGGRGHLRPRQFLLGVRRDARRVLLGTPPGRGGGALRTPGALGGAPGRRPSPSLVMVALFVVVMASRLRKVRAAAEEFERRHSQATGVVADTVSNLMAVRTAAAEPSEQRAGRRPHGPVGRRRPAGPEDLQPYPAPARDLHRARHVAGPAGRDHHGRPPLGVDRGALPHPLLLGPGRPRACSSPSNTCVPFPARSGRAAKFTAIAAEVPEITDAPRAGPLEARRGEDRGPPARASATGRRASSSTGSRSPSPPASTWHWSDHRGRASRPSPSCCCGSWTSATGRSWSTARTSATVHRRLAAPPGRLRAPGPAAAAPDHRREHLLRPRGRCR